MGCNDFDNYIIKAYSYEYLNFLQKVFWIVGRQ
jgi:hypothetical protein